MVQAGSTARQGGMRSFPRGYRAFRDQLVADGKLVALNGEVYRVPEPDSRSGGRAGSQCERPAGMDGAGWKSGIPRLAKCQIGRVIIAWEMAVG